MATTAVPAALQQQVRQEMTDVIHQLRLEMNVTVGGRIDMLNSINTALPKVSAKPIVSEPYRISDLIPRTWEGINDKGEFRPFHVETVPVDTSVARRRRNNACQR